MWLFKMVSMIISNSLSFYVTSVPIGWTPCLEIHGGNAGIEHFKTKCRGLWQLQGVAFSIFSARRFAYLVTVLLATFTPRNNALGVGDECHCLSWAVTSGKQAKNIKANPVMNNQQQQLLFCVLELKGLAACSGNWNHNLMITRAKH